MLLKRRWYNPLHYLTRGPRVHVNTIPIGNAFWVRVKPFMPLPRLPLGCDPTRGCSQHTCPPTPKAYSKTYAIIAMDLG